jgi:hypothetical protein|mmetsp:Transcript_453/g.765  ORF Transcript_453/g.765 Transcript_453/m.765 type:complete len:297 (-) Transcript_453:196-1086(-)
MLSGGDIFLIVVALLAWRLVRAIEDGRDLIANVLLKLRYLEKRIDKLSGGDGAYRNDSNKGSNEGGSNSSDTSSEDGQVASMREATRPLELSTQEFSDCLVGDSDVDTEKFMAACTEYTKMLGRMGAFAKLMVREVKGNINKINQTYQNNPESHKSVKSLLETEKNNNMHKEGAVLADPSSAMGLLWARRGLKFWGTVFDGLAECMESDSQVHVKKIAGQAYDEVLRPFNGWMTRSSFSMAINHMPDWESLYQRLGSSKEEVIGDMRRWSSVSKEVVNRLEKMQVDLDLEDPRKSI